jgi:hypothetical protein
MNREDDQPPAFGRDSDKDFDARLRGTWRSAVDAVPPALAGRLRAPRIPARAPARWPLGAALAAAAVAVVAIGLRPHPAGLPQAAPATVVAANASDATATLDRNPDFYAWLASPDAEQLALE